VEQVPLADFLSDIRNDFLAAWDPARQAILHFHPGDTGVMQNLFAAFANPVARDFGPLGELMKRQALDEAALDAVLPNLDAAYAPGVYGALGSTPAPDQVQVGQDATDICAALDAWAGAIETMAPTLPPGTLPAESSVINLVRCGTWDPVESVRTVEGWVRAPEDALQDAADGELSGSRLAGAQVNTALRVPLQFQGQVATAALYLAFGETGSAALAVLQAARSADPRALRAAVEAADQAYVASLRLPERVSPELRAFCKRVFLNLRAGTDRRTGAIVASISRQPSYHLDWPRDGSFFNAALDIAGVTELVSRRLDFYTRSVRTEPLEPTILINTPIPGWPGCPDCPDLPVGSWEMNYYADGLIGGNIRLEVDNTALLVWSYVSHAGYLEDPVERAAYLRRAWPTVRLAADFLAWWRDPQTGLVWPANEDDNSPFTQGLEGAGTVFGALRAAAMMARSLGEEGCATRWIERAAELRRAALRHLYVEGQGFLNQPRQDGGAIPPGSVNGWMASWLAWPTHFLPRDDPRLQELLRRRLQAILPAVRGEGAGGAYLTKDTVSAALALPPGPERDAALEVAERMAREVADPDTRHLGEVFLNVDEDRDGPADRGRLGLQHPGGRVGRRIAGADAPRAPVVRGGHWFPNPLLSPQSGHSQVMLLQVMPHRFSFMHS
jgi:hypothetical protein